MDDPATVIERLDRAESRITTLEGELVRLMRVFRATTGMSFAEMKERLAAIDATSAEG